MKKYVSVTGLLLLLLTWMVQAQPAHVRPANPTGNVFSKIHVGELCHIPQAESAHTGHAVSNPTVIHYAFSYAFTTSETLAQFVLSTYTRYKEYARNILISRCVSGLLFPFHHFM